MRILLGEDDEGLRKSVDLLLRRRSHKVDSVENGIDLMLMLEADPNYDVVITDHDMPLMTGLEVLRSIKSNPRLSSLPVILYTGNDLIKVEVLKLGGIYTEKGGIEVLYHALEQLHARAA